MNWMLLPLKRYADFQGRSRRKEYWMFALLMALLSIGLGLLGGVFASVGADGWALGALLPLTLFVVAVLIPSIAVQVRRFHDQDMSGWWILLNFVPYLGGLVVLVFMCIGGTRGPNRFGPDPKDPSGAEHLSEVFR
ncbi:MAG TPA: DUF805 domain-containing protein [Sphingomonas sp.]